MPLPVILWKDTSLAIISSLELIIQLAVYVRGKVDTNYIDLPEEWIGLVDEDSITVQLTPIGKHQNLYVDEINNTKILIKNSNLLTKSINAFYFIQGTRKDIQPLQTERDA